MQATQLLIYNLATLVALSVISGFLSQRWDRHTGKGLAIQGILFGSVAILAMLQPYVMAPGIVFDGRSVVISLCGLFFGPVSASIAAIMAIAFRLAEGGAGAIMGVSVIVASAVIGILFYYDRQKNSRRVGAGYLLLFGLIVHIVMALLTFTLPREFTTAVLQSIGIPILVFYPITTVLIGKILSDQEENIKSILRLKESEARWKYALEGAGDGVWDWDIQSGRNYFSPQWKKMIGFEEHEIENNYKEWEKRVHPDDLPRALNALKDHLKGKTPIYQTEFRFRRKDGNYMWILDRGKVIERSADGKPLRFIGTHINIDERKRNERQLLAISNNINGPASRVNVNLRYTFANNWYEDAYGISSDTMIGNSMRDVMGEKNFNKVQPYINRVLQGEKCRFEIELELKTAKRIFDVQYIPDIGTDKNIDGFFIIGNDVTELKNAIKALQESEERYRLVFEHSNDAILLTHPSGAIFSANPEALRLFNRSEDELREIGRDSVVDLNDPRLMPALEERKRTGSFKGELNFMRKDGTVFPGEIASTIYKDADGNEKSSMIIRDVTERNRIQLDLEKKNKYIQAILDNLPIGVGVYEIDNGRVAYVNAKFAEIYGWPADELTTSDRFFELIFPDERYRKKMKNRVTTDIASGDLKRMRWDGAEITTQTGEKRIISAANIPVFDQNIMFATVQDITARRQAEEMLKDSEERFRSIVEGAPDPIFIQVDLKFAYVNPAMVELLGAKDESELVGTPVFKRFHPDYHERIRERIKKIVVDEKAVPDLLEQPFIRLDNSQVWVETRGVPIEYDGKQGALVFVRNITERKETEDTIIKLNTELEQRVRDRTAELEAANKELESFAYSVSHDLRAPLRAIDGFARFLYEDYAHKIDKEGHRLLEVIRENARKMDRLITDLLSLSRVTRNKMKYDRIDMKKLVHSIYDEIAVDTTKNTYTFTVHSLPAAHGDQTLIRQVMINLISNAIKYSARSELKEIEIGGKSDGSFNTYYVKDSGIGFNPQYKHKLFAVFQRLHSDAEVEGTGVGLAIVQRIVSRHGGNVWADGEEGSGATFYITLPTANYK